MKLHAELPELAMLSWAQGHQGQRALKRPPCSQRALESQGDVQTATGSRSQPPTLRGPHPAPSRAWALSSFTLAHSLQVVLGNPGARATKTGTSPVLGSRLHQGGLQPHPGPHAVAKPLAGRQAQEVTCPGTPLSGASPGGSGETGAGRSHTRRAARSRPSPQPGCGSRGSY